MNRDQLEFVTYCIGNLSRELQLPVTEVYARLQRAHLVGEYIVAAYDVLHTLDYHSIVDDLTTAMREEGVL